jgi:hypothetical protein
MQDFDEGAVLLFLAEPLALNGIRVLSCKVCGAVTYVRYGTTPDGYGDPVRHMAWHRERGEVE